MYGLIIAILIVLFLVVLVLLMKPRVFSATIAAGPFKTELNIVATRRSKDGECRMLRVGNSGGTLTKRRKAARRLCNESGRATFERRYRVLQAVRTERVV